jgi:hypothetical protein
MARMDAQKAVSFNRAHTFFALEKSKNGLRMREFLSSSPVQKALSASRN